MEMLGLIVALLLVGFGIRFCALENEKYFAPKEMAVQSKVWKESNQYNDGMIRDLENLRIEYLKASDTKKSALKSVILHRFSVFNVEKLTPDLREFYRELRDY